MTSLEGRGLGSGGLWAQLARHMLACENKYWSGAENERSGAGGKDTRADMFEVPHEKTPLLPLFSPQFRGQTSVIQ